MRLCREGYEGGIGCGVGVMRRGGGVDIDRAPRRAPDLFIDARTQVEERLALRDRRRWRASPGNVSPPNPVK